MPHSRPIPDQFTDNPAGARAASGEFIMSGSLTTFLEARPAAAPTGVPARPMPGFHRRKEVQRMLRRWRNSISLWGRVWASRPRDPWEASQRFTLPQHTTYIK